MKDYAAMSDFEINKSVALALGFRLYKDGKSCRENHVAIEEGRCGAFAMDWCNNPADAWPIIVENGISLIKCTVGSGYWSAEIITDIDDLTDKLFQCQSSFDYQDANPLRAAMIVFLMMKDGE